MLTPLALVLGARAGLSIEQIDDLGMALELLVLNPPAVDREARFAVADGGLEVRIGGIEHSWLEQRRQMLAVLVSELTLEAGGVRLRVG